MLTYCVHVHYYAMLYVYIVHFYGLVESIKLGVSITMKEVLVLSTSLPIAYQLPGDTIICYAKDKS